MILSLIAALDQNRCIGRKNTLPWHLPDDLRHFRALTSGKTVIMGRATYESIGHALPNRRNIVLTHRSDFLASQCDVVRSIDEALSLCALDDEIFVIGGAQIYAQTIAFADRLYLTHVHTIISDGDAFFPDIDDARWKLVSSERHEKDDDHAYAFTMSVLTKIK